MQQELWQNVIRAFAITALKAIGTAEALELAQQYSASTQ